MHDLLALVGALLQDATVMLTCGLAVLAIGTTAFVVISRDSLGRPPQDAESRTHDLTAQAIWFAWMAFALAAAFLLTFSPLVPA